MILKNTYGCTLVLDTPEDATSLENKFSGSSLERKKIEKPLAKYDLSGFTQYDLSEWGW